MSRSSRPLLISSIFIALAIPATLLADPPRGLRLLDGNAKPIAAPSRPIRNFAANGALAQLGATTKSKLRLVSESDSRAVAPLPDAIVRRINFNQQPSQGSRIRENSVLAAPNSHESGYGSGDSLANPNTAQAESQWRGRNGEPQPAPPGERAPERAIPLDGPVAGGDVGGPDLGWTPRASGAKLIGRPVTPNRAPYGAPYASQLPKDVNRSNENNSGADPFDDPFGDGVGTAPLTVRRPYAQDAAQDPPNNSDPAPTPPASGQFSGDQPPPDPNAPRRPNPDCPHVFNGVDCCAEAEQCERLKKMVYSQSIRMISLDMTPRFKPGAEAAEEEVEKARRLGMVESRDWTDRSGRVIAMGKFIDLRDHRVVVEDSNGEVVRLRFRDLSDVDRCYVTAWWSLPTECTLGDQVYAGRHFMPITMTWKASALCHKPLYFEEVQLERYGHTMGPLLHPAFSSAHFFFNVGVLPYNVGVHPLNECQYPLGHYRPGDCAPWLLPAPPISLRGALLQTGAVLGGVYALP